MSAARRAVLHALIAAGDAVTVATLSDRLGQHSNTTREHLDALVAADRAERLRSRPVGRGRPAWLYRAVGPSSSTGGAAGSGRALGSGRTGGTEGVRDAGGTEGVRDAGGAEGIRGIGDDGGLDDVDDVGGSEYAALASALIEEVARSDPNPRAVARQAGERWGRTLADHRRVQRVPVGDGNRTVVSGDASAPADAVLDMLTGLRFEPEPAARPGVVRLTTCPLLDAARRNPDLVCQVHLGIVRGALERVGGDPDGVALEPFAEPGACLLTLPELR